MHSLQFLTMAIPVFKEQVLALKPKLLLLALAVACDNIMALKEVNPVSDLLLGSSRPRKYHQHGFLYNDE